LAPETAQKRLQFVNLAWLGLGLTAAVFAAVGGATPQNVFAAALMAWVPGLAGYAAARSGASELSGLPVIAWLVFALVAVVLTGGNASPLIILLIIAPLTGLLAGKPRLAAEAGTFAALALFCVFVATPLGGIPQPPVGTAQIAAPFAFAGLVTGALAIWQLVSERAAAPLSQADVSPTPPEPEPQPVTMTGISWLDVTPEGRLRRVQGDTFGLTAMRAGAALTGLFTDHDFALPAPGETARQLVAAELVSGRRVRVLTERHTRGFHLLMMDAAVETPPSGDVAELEERLRARTAFFASLGHDLKTPLNAILGYAEIMQAELMGPLPKPYADYPSIIHESGIDLLLLVDDILDLARAEAGQPRLEPEPVDLTASAESVIRQMTGHADRAGVTLKLKTSGEVWAEADARAVRQIWQNLVSNAIKYSVSGKTVTLETRLEGETAMLSVSDRGAGIAAADLARVTEPFAQGAGAKPGTGLGLSVVRRFAELQGGALRIESKPGKGTRAEVTLPRASEADLVPLEEAAE